MRISGAAIFLMLVLGLAGCGFSPIPPAPSPIPQAAPPPAPPSTPIQLAVFTDPASGFSTSDVRDVQEQIVRFNTAEQLIWTADGTRFPGYRVTGNFVRWDKYYEVRFATKDGERRAYFCGHDHDYICDIEVVAGRLLITEINVLCPGI